MADKLWTLPEVAEYLGVPEKTIYMWRYRGIGPRGMRIGRHVRFRGADVESWVEMQADSPRPAA